MFFFQAEDGIRDYKVTGVQTCALPILAESVGELTDARRALRFPEAAGRVADADHAMHRRGADAGCQARGPARERLAPGCFRELVREERVPVGDALRASQRGTPVVAPDRLAREGPRLHPPAVGLEPGHHRV